MFCGWHVWLGSSVAFIPLSSVWHWQYSSDVHRRWYSFKNCSTSDTPCSLSATPGLARAWSGSHCSRPTRSWRRSRRLSISTRKRSPTTNCLASSTRQRANGRTVSHSLVFIMSTVNNWTVLRECKPPPRRLTSTKSDPGFASRFTDYRNPDSDLGVRSLPKCCKFINLIESEHTIQLTWLDDQLFTDTYAMCICRLQ